MNTEEMQALDRVIDHYIKDEAEHAQAAGDPPGHICDSLMTLDRYRQTRPREMESERKGQAGPIGIVRDHPSKPPEDSQGPSVVDRSRKIEVRWAKETIGLVANELSRAYTEIEITRDGHTIPGKLGSIAKRLSEALQRLGVVDDDDLDREIPF